MSIDVKAAGFGIRGSLSVGSGTFHHWRQHLMFGLFTMVRPAALSLCEPSISEDHPSCKSFRGFCRFLTASSFRHPLSPVCSSAPIDFVLRTAVFVIYDVAIKIEYMYTHAGWKS